MEPCIYSQDEFFAESIRRVLKETSAGCPSLMCKIPILICSGMTLSEIMKLFGKGLPCSGKCVVICSHECERMLSGTQGYHAALFINLRASISELKAAFFRYGRLRFYENRSVRKNFGLTYLNCCVVNDFFKGEVVDIIARKYGMTPKGAYRHIELSMSKIGVKTRQEFYYKWLLIFSNGMLDNECLAENISSKMNGQDEYAYFSIVSV